MFKLASSFLTNCFKVSSSSVQLIREFKTKGEYFRRLGYEYNKIYKGGLIPVLKFTLIPKKT